jgi:hypothetical protein
MVNGARVDYCSVGTVRFIDARGRKLRLHEFETDGAAILRSLNDTTWGVWPLGDIAVLRLDASRLDLAPPLSVSAFDEAGTLLKRVEAPLEDGLVTLPLEPAAFRFEISAARI